MSVLSTRGGWHPRFYLSPDELAQMRRLWEGAPELPARKIAEVFMVTKNSVVGHANRRGWKPRRERKEPTTIFTRLDAIYARMDQVLAETRPFVEDREKRYGPVYRGEWTEDRRLKAAARLRALGGNKAQRDVA